MVIIPDKILNSIKQYISTLELKGFPIKEAYLFGSYANGNATELSDIDIAVISDKFEGNRFLDKEKIRGIYWKIDEMLSPLPLSPNDLNDDWFVRSEIVEKGIKIL